MKIIAVRRKPLHPTILNRCVGDGALDVPQNDDESVGGASETAAPYERESCDVGADAHIRP